MHVQLGDFVNPGQPVVTQTDFSRARLIAGLSSAETGNVHAGDIARVTFDDLGGLTLQGTVTSVGRVRDAVSGTYPVEFSLQHPAVNQLREGMVGTVVWHSADTKQLRLSIPSAALVRRDGRIVTFVIESGRAIIRNIRIGNSDGRRVEVIEGLSKGEMVVTEGQFALRDGAPVEIDNPPLT